MNTKFNETIVETNGVRTIAGGGTGSTTAANALTALGAVAKSGDTMTGKLIAAADDTSSKLNIGVITGTSPTSTVNGDLWITGGNRVAWRSGGVSYNSAATNLANTFNNNQIIDLSSSTATALRVTQRGLAEALRIEDETNPDNTPFIVDNMGNVGIGLSSISGNNQKLTVVGNISATGLLTVSGGNSNLWNSVYSTTNTLSSNWQTTHSTVSALSGSWTQFQPDDYPADAQANANVEGDIAVKESKPYGTIYNLGGWGDPTGGQALVYDSTNTFDVTNPFQTPLANRWALISDDGDGGYEAIDIAYQEGGAYPWSATYENGLGVSKAQAARLVGAPLAATASEGTSTFASRADHVHPFPAEANNWNSVYSSVSPVSANWNSVYNQNSNALVATTYVNFLTSVNSYYPVYTCPSDKKFVLEETTFVILSAVGGQPGDTMPIFQVWRTSPSNTNNEMSNTFQFPSTNTIPANRSFRQSNINTTTVGRAVLLGGETAWLKVNEGYSAVGGSPYTTLSGVMIIAGYLM